MNSRQLITAIYTVGAVMTLAGAAVYVTRWPLAPWLYTTGAVLFAFAQICSPLTVTSFTLKRLRMQQVFGSLALVLAGLFMFFTRGNEWIVCLLIGAVLQLYTVIRIPQEEKKEKAGKSA